jgi:hypothetical protein
MRTKLRSKATLLFLTIAVLLAVPAVAFAADQLLSDVDTINAGPQPVRDLGTVAPGATLTPNVNFSVVCNGAAGHFNSDDSVTLNFVSGSVSPAAAGASVTATNAVVSGPSSWATDSAGCGSFTTAQATGSSQATIKAPSAPGTYSYTVSYNLVRSGADNNEIGGAVNPATFQLTVQQQPQTITFNQPDPKIYGVADFDPGATASSGLQVSYNSDTPSVCTIVSGKVHIVSAGDCKVTASQAGNSNYSAAPPVQRTIVIGKAALTVVTNDQTKKFGEDNPELTGSINGIQYGDPITATRSTTATQNSDVGTYPITATLNDPQGKLGNYNVTNDGGTLTINRADATINVQGFTGPYDGNAHGASGTATGVNDVDLSGQLNLGETFTNVPGGTAHWTFNGGTNYNDDEGDVAININKADATIVVQGFDGTYDGDPHGATTATATGADGSNLNRLLHASDTFTDVPGGTGNWTFEGNGNHKDASGTFEVKIAKANATVNVTGYTGDYDGQAHGASGTATGVKGESLTSQLNLGATFTDVPGGTANWSFNGGTNYNSKSGSVAVTINKANQTINFAAPGNKMFGDAPFAVSATASSTLPVTFTTSGNCSIAGNTVTLTASGSCTITAKQGGNGNYNAAPDVAHTFQIGAWTLKGFYQPVDMDVVTTTGTTTALNTVKNGSTVPMKFNVLKGTTALTDNTNNAVVKSFTQQSVLCPSGAGVVADEIEVTTTGGTSLRYDATAGQWIQNWQTPKKPNTCYNVTLTTQDGSKLVAHFQLK